MAELMLKEGDGSPVCWVGVFVSGSLWYSQCWCVCLWYVGIRLEWKVGCMCVRVEAWNWLEGGGLDCLT